MSSGDGKLTRIGVFYDGNYFLHVRLLQNVVSERNLSPDKWQK